MKDKKQKNSRESLRKMTQIGMLSAIAAILMLLQFPLPFVPPFYQFDFSEVPVLIGSFALGPLAGVIIQLVKVLLFMITGTSSAFGVGELANFLIGCALVVPAGFIYKYNKTQKGAILGMVVGVVSMTVIGSLLNAFFLLPFFAWAFEMPMDVLIGMGTAVNAHIINLPTFVAFAVAPFNLFKGLVVSIIVLLVYKRIRPIFRMR